VDLDAASEQRASADASPFIQLLIEVRTELRAAKQWAIADSIRDRLTQHGVALEDGPNGTTFRLSQD